MVKRLISHFKKENMIKIGDVDEGYESYSHEDPYFVTNFLS